MLTVLGLAEHPGGGAEAVNALAAELRLPAGSLEEVMVAILAARAEARAERDFARSDLIRDRLEAAGIVVEDTADGARWFRR
jgi:cysteinyl-tRNA synthetase